MNKVALPLAYSYLNKNIEDVINSMLILLQTVIQACFCTLSDPDGDNEKQALG